MATRMGDDRSVVVTKLRRVEVLATGTRVGSLVYAGDPVGIDWLGREVRDETDVVIASVERFGNGWLVAYRAVRVRQELAPAH